MPNPAITWEETENRRVLAGSGLRLVFTWSGDRWIHVLERFGTGDPADRAGTPLAWSLEAGADHTDASTIVSPAYQEIHPHDVGGQEGAPLCVLLTGRLLDHQFSAVVTFGVDSRPPGGILVDWDVADRCRTPVAYLAATYQTPLGSGSLADADGHSVRWDGESAENASLEFLAGPPESVALAEAGRNGSRIQAVAKVDAAVFTHRLRYRWRWSPAADRAS